MNLILGDSDGMDEMSAMMPNPSQMMGQPGMEQKNYAALFKSEKENYEILNYKFRLDDAEDAFLYKYSRNKKQAVAAWIVDDNWKKSTGVNGKREIFIKDNKLNSSETFH